MGQSSVADTGILKKKHFETVKGVQTRKAAVRNRLTRKAQYSELREIPQVIESLLTIGVVAALPIPKADIGDVAEVVDSDEIHEPTWRPWPSSRNRVPVARLPIVVGVTVDLVNRRHRLTLNSRRPGQSSQAIHPPATQWQSSPAR